MADRDEAMTPDEGRLSDVEVDSDVAEGKDSANEEMQQPVVKKRGRPSTKDVQMKKQQTEMNKILDNQKILEDKVEELTAANLELKESNTSTFMELEELKAQFKDLESEKMELLEQLANEGDCSTSEPKPLGLFIHDSPMSNIMGKLPKAVSWDKLCVNLSDLDSRDITMYAERKDLLLFSIGSDDIRQGTKGLEAFAKLNKVATEISKQTQVVVTSIPPTSTRGNTSQISLFNFKLEKNQVPYQKIIIEFARASLDENDSLNDNAVNTMAHLIEKQMKIPTARKALSSDLPESGFDTQVLMEIQQKDIGKVIGKSGYTIAKLTNDYNVKMTIGKWCEPRKDKRDEITEIMDAILIKGNSNQVKAVMSCIEGIVGEPALKRPKQH